MMRKTIPDKSQFALLDILLDRIVIIVLGNLLLGIRPAGDLDNHIENLRTCCGRRGEKRDIMPCRDDNSILFEEDAVLEGIRGAYTSVNPKANRGKNGGLTDCGKGRKRSG
jgi:hypothetical protein